jgi:hypothetical protein
MKILFIIGLILLLLLIVSKKYEDFKEFKKQKWFKENSLYYTVPYLIFYISGTILIFYSLTVLILNYYIREKLL